MKTENYYLGSQFAQLVANGESDQLTDDEISDFEYIEDTAKLEAPEGYVFSHWSIGDDTDEFAQCEATGRLGERMTFTAVYFLKDTAA